MKILMQMIGGGGNDVTRIGQYNALVTAGHQVELWNKNQRNAFDIFSLFEPDIFIGMTYELDRALIKNIASRPNLKVCLLSSDWGKLAEEIDRTEFPVLIASQNEIDKVAELKEKTGKPDFLYAQYPDKYLQNTHGKWMEHLNIPVISLCNAWCPLSYGLANAQLEFESQISFIGGLWDYKRRCIFPYLFPLLNPIGKYHIKIYGYNHWRVPQYIGSVRREQEAQIFASSKICPNISEPHSQKYGHDLVERGFKVIGNGQSLCIGDYVEGFREFFKEDEFIMAKSPEEYEEKIKYFLDKKNTEERKEIRLKGQKAVLKKHSYFHRMCDMFIGLGLFNEAKNILQVYYNLLEQRGQLYLVD